MSAVDELVRQWMERVEASGEMRSAAGKPLPLNDGFDQTPEELRMAFKALKNAGYVPDEVQMLRDVAALRTKLDQTREASARSRLQQQIAELDSLIRIRLERIRTPSR